MNRNTPPHLLLTLFIALVSIGCPQEDDGFAVASGETEDSTPDDIDPNNIAWDVSPPSEVGTMVEFVVNCGLFDGPILWCAELTEEGWTSPAPWTCPRWEQVTTGQMLFPECEVEEGVGDDWWNGYFEWDNDGHILFGEASDFITHDLEPATETNRWFGGVYAPEGDIPEDCLNELEAAGTPYPVPISMNILD